MELLVACYAASFAAGIFVTLKAVTARLAPTYRQGFAHMYELMKKDGLDKGFVNGDSE